MQRNSLHPPTANNNARQSITFTSIASKVGLNASAEGVNTSNTQRNASLRNLPYRERQRIYKQRYRTKQQTFQDGLKETNKQLHEEIQQLQVRLQNPCTTTNSSTMWTVATEYFRLFQHGLHTPYETPRAQLDFLQAMAAPDISAGTVQSVATIVRNWVVFTRFFQDIDMQLQCLKKVDDCTLLATATVTIALSRHSLVNLFPHLFYGGVVRGMQGKESRVYRIAKKLVDQRLVLRGFVHFDWNHSSHRVERIDSEFNMMTPLLQLLGSVEDVSFVFNSGLITPSFNVVAAVCPELEKHTDNIMPVKPFIG